MKSAELINSLGLAPLAGEGGLWAPLYRDGQSNAIYFMMVAPDFSAWHRIAEPELWIHIDGEPIELNTIEDGRLQRRVLDRDHGIFAHRVDAQTWMSARPMGDWALVICSLTPPFSGMELADRSQLRSEFPELENLPELFHD